MGITAARAKAWCLLRLAEASPAPPLSLSTGSRAQTSLQWMMTRCQLYSSTACNLQSLHDAVARRELHRKQVLKACLEFWVHSSARRSEHVLKRYQVAPPQRYPSVSYLR